MTIPADATNVNLDSATDDPKLARAELSDLVDKFNTLKAHLAAITIVDKSLAIGHGLENNADTDLRVKLASVSALLRDTNGLALDIDGLTEDTAPDLANDFLVSQNLEKVRLSALAGLPRAYLAGLTLSNGTDAVNDIDIAAGECRDDAGTQDIELTAAIGKRIDATWAAGGTPGTPTGGRSSTVSLTNDTWYHVFLGLVSGTVEAGFDTSLTAANLIADHSFSKVRRIGSVRRGTATNLGFTQNGDGFIWDASALDRNSALGVTTSVVQTLTVPTGLPVLAEIRCSFSLAGGGTQLFLASSLFADNETPSTSNATLVGNDASTQGDANTVHVLTNTSGQIRLRTANAGTGFSVRTIGWVDRRGRDD